MKPTISGSTLRIGVSSCLLGEGVRYDGGHKRDDFLTRQLAPRYLDPHPRELMLRNLV